MNQANAVHSFADASFLPKFKAVISKRCLDEEMAGRVLSGTRPATPIFRDFLKSAGLEKQKRSA